MPGRLLDLPEVRQYTTDDGELVACFPEQKWRFRAAMMVITLSLGLGFLSGIALLITASALYMSVEWDGWESGETFVLAIILAGLLLVMAILGLMFMLSSEPATINCGKCFCLSDPDRSAPLVPLNGRSLEQMKQEFPDLRAVGP